MRSALWVVQHVVAVDPFSERDQKSPSWHLSAAGSRTLLLQVVQTSSCFRCRQRCQVASVPRQQLLHRNLSRCHAVRVAAAQAARTKPTPKRIFKKKGQTEHPHTILAIDGGGMRGMIPGVCVGTVYVNTFTAERTRQRSIIKCKDLLRRVQPEPRVAVTISYCAAIAALVCSALHSSLSCIILFLQ